MSVPLGAMNYDAMNPINQVNAKTSLINNEKQKDKLSESIEHINIPHELPRNQNINIDFIASPNLNTVKQSIKCNSTLQNNLGYQNNTNEHSSASCSLIIRDVESISNNLNDRIYFLKRVFAPICLGISGLVGICYLAFLIIYVILSCALVNDCTIYLSVGFVTSSIIIFNSLRILITIMSNQKEEFSKCFFYGVIPLFFVLLGDILYSLCSVRDNPTKGSEIKDKECETTMHKIKVTISIFHLIISVIYLLFPVFSTILIYRYNYNLQKLIQNCPSTNNISKDEITK